MLRLETFSEAKSFSSVPPIAHPTGIQSDNLISITSQVSQGGASRRRLGRFPRDDQGISRRRLFVLVIERWTTLVIAVAGRGRQRQRRSQQWGRDRATRR